MAPRKPRSPSYPAFNLRLAVDRANQIYEQGSSAPLNREALSLAMGYKPTSSAAKQAIATLRYYGLLEPRGGGQMSVSPLAVKLLMPESDLQKHEAACEALVKPPVFAELAEKFNNQIPSEGVIVPTLAQDGGFNKDAAQRVAKAYISSALWVKELVDPGTDDSEDRRRDRQERQENDGIDPQGRDKSPESTSSRVWFRIALGDTGHLLIYAEKDVVPAAEDLRSAITVLDALAGTLPSTAKKVEGELLPREQTPRLNRH